MSEMTILFVCTGNTCRSPMAEAIARHVIEQRSASSSEDGAVVVMSAGVIACDGCPATAEAIGALQSMGIDLSDHRSQLLVPELIQRATIVWGMTDSHVAAVEAMAEGTQARIEKLDPNGEDIPDPIGMAQNVYSETAQHLYDLIKQRLEQVTK